MLTISRDSFCIVIFCTSRLFSCRYLTSFLKAAPPASAPRTSAPRTSAPPTSCATSIGNDTSPAAAMSTKFLSHLGILSLPSSGEYGMISQSIWCIYLCNVVRRNFVQCTHKKIDPLWYAIWTLVCPFLSQNQPLPFSCDGCPGPLGSSRVKTCSGVATELRFHGQFQVDCGSWPALQLCTQ